MAVIDAMNDGDFSAARHELAKSLALALVLYLTHPIAANFVIFSKCGSFSNRAISPTSARSGSIQSNPCAWGCCKSSVWPSCVDGLFSKDSIDPRIQRRRPIERVSDRTSRSALALNFGSGTSAAVAVKA